MTWFSLVSCAQLYPGRPRSDKKMSTNSWMLPGSNLWDFRFRTTAFRWPDCRNPFTKEFASWNRWPHFFVSGQNESSRAIQISSFRLTDFSFFFCFFFSCWAAHVHVPVWDSNSARGGYHQKSCVERQWRNRLDSHRDSLSSKGHACRSRRGFISIHQPFSVNFIWISNWTKIPKILLIF